jgi:hypothetical protein
MSIISRILNNPEVREEAQKAVHDFQDPIKSIGERVVEAVKDVLGQNPKSEKPSGYVKS